ncbi:unnamed protein product, partial [Ectocarpus sp. 12 AP-2014]
TKQRKTALWPERKTNMVVEKHTATGTKTNTTTTNMMRPSKLQENWTPVHITRLEHTTTSSPSANERQLATATGCRHNRTKTRNN